MLTIKEKRAAFAEANAYLNTNTINMQKNYNRQAFAFKAIDARQRHAIYNTLLSLLKIRGVHRKAAYLEIIQDVPKRLWQDVKAKDNENLIYRTASLPTRLENALICQALLRNFKQETLLSVDGFTLWRDYGDNGEIIEGVRLDVSSYPHGFIAPTYNGKLINALLVSRHPDDPKPFILRTRQKELDFTKGVNHYA